jgi:hypothetical protein
MVINNLDVVGISRLPSEADPPLFMDPDAELSLPVAPRSFEPVAWRHSQILERSSNF